MTEVLESTGTNYGLRLIETWDDITMPPEDAGARIATRRAEYVHKMTQNINPSHPNLPRFVESAEQEFDRRMRSIAFALGYDYSDTL